MGGPEILGFTNPCTFVKNSDFVHVYNNIASQLIENQKDNYIFDLKFDNSTINLIDPKDYRKNNDNHIGNLMKKAN